MRNIFLYTILYLCALSASAVPAKRQRCTLFLADGTSVEAIWTGDENMHFYQTDEGLYLECDKDGIARFVNTDSIQRCWNAKASARKKVFAKRNAVKRKNKQNIITGSKRGLVILVQFPQTPFHFTNADFQRFFNERGYSDELNTGSVRDYFHDASYGLFDFSFDVVGPVTMKKPLSYYGGNNINGDDAHTAEMVSQAIHMIDDSTDFSLYDWDNDGEVEHVFVIHSGFDEAQSRRDADIWSHAWFLSEAYEYENDGEGAVIADGVTIDAYATSAELLGTSGTSITGISIACHEFAHCFGLPDFYDTMGSNFGMDSWDLMDYGEYNGNGGTPAGFTSYERMFCGWLQPIELSEATAVKDMAALTSEPIAYILRNDGNDNEYYLFENRQQTSWDKHLEGHGMLILHVDYDSSAWAENTVNNTRSHQRMTIIPADNLCTSFTLPADPWPGTLGKTELTDMSVPAWSPYNSNLEGKKLMNHSITEITESADGLISFIFDSEALGIGRRPSFPNETHLYNLSGQRVSENYSGIIIQEGKKTIKHNR